jgi:hypothetical protein
VYGSSRDLAQHLLRSFFPRRLMGSSRFQVPDSGEEGRAPSDGPDGAAFSAMNSTAR